MIRGRTINVYFALKMRRFNVSEGDHVILSFLDE